MYIRACRNFLKSINGSVKKIPKNCNGPFKKGQKGILYFSFTFFNALKRFRQKRCTKGNLKEVEKEKTRKSCIDLQIGIFQLSKIDLIHQI